MKYKADRWNNFCRVFELPADFSGEFCFGPGVPTNFQMVDWFEPVPNLARAAVSKDVWREKVGEIETVEVDHESHSELMGKFLRIKNYVKPSRKYLVLTSFNMVFLFDENGVVK